MKTSVKSISTAIALTALFVLVAWLAGAFHEKIPATKLAVQATAFKGEQYQIRSVIEDSIETATGTINARDETTVSSRIIATINQVSVRAGDTVKQGELLFELDDRDLKSRVEQINQSMLAAQAVLDETEAEFFRVKTLYEKQVASRADYDRVKAALQSRRADYQRSQGQLQEAKTALSFTVINSPIAGKVIERYAEPGDTASPGNPLLKIYNPSLLRLDAQVRESLAANINIGDELNAYIDALKKQMPALVDEIVPSADPGSRSITVKALLPSVGALYPGMFGRLLIPTGKSERIYIPITAISRMGQLEFVQVLVDGKPVRRYIRSGKKNNQGGIEVLSGLWVGETIVIPEP